MAYKAYLIEQFDTTHENIFFKELSNKLAEKFKNENSLSVLVGNLYLNGNQIDALFIRNGQITIIDFKNYGGKLNFSERNSWTIQFNNQIIQVTGGNYNRNPLQQINQYRRTIIDFLDSNNIKIFQNGRNDINWGHISGVVLFHQEIFFEKENIPNNLVYFHISDKKNITDLLYNIKSKSLFLPDNEIYSLLKVLDISEENLFKEADTITKTDDWQNKLKFDLIKRLSKKEKTSTIETVNIINYYKILLEVESFREENKLEKPLKQPINIDEIEQEIIIDFQNNKDILTLLSNNKELTFPKNIFLGINFRTENSTQNRILLYQIILFSEINTNSQKIKVKCSNFELYPPSFYLIQKSTDEYIDNLNKKISNLESLKDKIEFLRNEFATFELEFSNSLTIALTEQSLFNVQLSLELKRLKDKHLDDLKEGIINSFVHNTPLINKNSSEIKKFIKITELNSEQIDAVKSSLQNEFTVITGPPGTGKTQVILNIIGNAIINNKKVLVASKNNKAVDNVSERFFSNYLLRVGSKEIINGFLIPTIDKFLEKEYTYNSNIDEIAKTLDKIQLNIDEIKYKLEKIETLPEEINKSKEKIKCIEQNYNSYIKSINEKEKELFFDNKFQFSINKSNIELLLFQLKNYNRNFISRFNFKIRNQSNILDTIVIFEKNILPDINSYIYEKSPLFINGKTNINIIVKHLNEYLNVYNNYLRHKEFENRNKKEFEVESILLETKKKELDSIMKEFNTLNENLINFEKDFINNSILYLETFINNKLHKKDNGVIASFKSYLGKSINDSNYDNYISVCKKFLDLFLVFNVTSLSIKNSIALTKEIFDILVIDESSQCDIASAIPLIFRAKQVVVIGDPFQLKHITSVKKFEENYLLNYFKLSEINYDYVKNSLYDVSHNLSNLSNIKTIFLREHFRCHPDIINFSNSFFYNNELIIKTNDITFNKGDKGIIWYDVKDNTNKVKNLNLVEKEFVINLANDLILRFPNVEIGITTPFKDQKDLISKYYNNKNTVVHTIHKFQGDEKDIIILSLVVTENSKSSLCNFINIWAPYVLNVALTRAKSTLYIVGDFNFCKNNEINRNKPLSKLANYVESIGKLKRVN